MTGTKDQQIDDYLGTLKAAGRSAPDGRYWDELYRLITREFPKDTHPSVPLILAGSIASNAEKHQRLREHLSWAGDRGRLLAALDFLSTVPEDGWNVGGPGDWSKSFSWEDGE